jgi:hypothetical protein
MVNGWKVERICTAANLGNGKWWALVLSSGEWDRTTDTRLMKPGIGDITPSNVNNLWQGSGELSALLAHLVKTDPEFLHLLLAWNTLPQHHKVVIKEIVKAGK